LFEATIEPAVALELIKHAAGCARCGRRLRELTFICDPDEESVSEIVGQLKSSAPEWQRATAKILASESRTTEARTSRGTWRWLAAAAAVLVMLSVGLTWNRLKALRVEQMLAQAYTDGRPFEFRLPDRGYSTFKQQMGAPSTFQNPSLMKANADIVDLPETDPRAKWLRGRAELLGRDVDAAISHLQNLDLPGGDTSLDLAVALAVRGDGGTRAEDWGRGLDYVSRYLASHPNSREGLYNKALLLERLQLIDDAIAAWEQYLKIDPTGPWAGEANRHKEDLQKRKTAWQLRRDRLAAAPAQLAALLASPDSADRPDAEGFLSRGQLINLARQTRTVQTAVGDLLLKQHQDGFLRDFFEHSTTSTEAAFGHLARAFDSIDKERYEVAVAAYLDAETAFAAAGNVAAKYRASLERTYALQRSVQPRECAALAQQIQNELSAKSVYPWMQIQAEIQVATCSEMSGNTADALNFLQQAQELAESRGYLEAGLRASGIYSESLARLGDRTAVWALGVRDMARYWNSASHPTRAYQILMNQFWAAEKADWTYATTVLGNAACREIGRTPEFPAAELSCRIELAGAARRVKDEPLASAQLKAAAKLADSVEGVTGAQSPAQKALIRYAAALVEAGDTRGAADRLQRVETALGSDNFITKLQYLTAVGRVHLADRQIEKAESSFDQAKGLIMHHLAGLANEIDQTETAEVATLYRLAMEAHIPSRESGTRNLRTKDLEGWEDFRARIRAPAGSPETVSKIAPKLTEETALILVRLRGGIAAWTVDDRGISSRWIPLDTDELDKSIRRMTELCADPKSRRSDIEREGTAALRLADCAYCRTPAREKLHRDRA
jgi:tetratricopeptide (TPR) repeat protein